MQNTLKNQRRFRLALGAGASFGVLAFASMAAAQEVETIPPAPVAEEASGDTVVVTGSRIRRQVDTTIDVTEIGAAEITDRGFTNVIEGIEQLPFVGAGVNNQGGNVQFGDNNAFPDLLNLGTNRTLSLVNGRRFVGANQATVFVPDNQNGAQVDLTVINPALIERTEILTVGGGPIYGADAVAGVVNVILKDDFEGKQLLLQGGLTQEGDGGNYRASGVWGKNFLGGRANITLAGEYSHSDLIRSSLGGNRVADQALASFLNPLNLSATDGIPSTIFQGGTTNPLIPTGGILATSQFLTAASNGAFFPNTGTQFPGGLSAFQFAQTPAGQAIDPALFIGTFGNVGQTLRIPNTDPATSAFLPFRAVTLQFDPSGNLVPFNFGDIQPPLAAQRGLVVGGDGFPNAGFNNLQSEQTRYAFNALGKYEFSDSLRWKGNLLFADVENASIGAPLSANPLGNTTAGNRSLPVYIDQNPFFNAGNLATINGLVGQGLTVPTIGGDRVLYLGRSLLDVTGPIDSGNRSRTYRIENVLEGEFEAIDRQFNWDISFVYGRSDNKNFNENVLDVEFALAADVVQGANGPVCRQQTLGAPEPIAVRNPGLAFINTGLPTPVTPTAEQIAACQPLNLFGFGAPSQAAIDYILTDVDSSNSSQQFYGAGSLGGEVIELPGGPLQFNSQFEWRRESNEFTPGAVFGLGLAQNTLGQPSQGVLRFFEGGTEFVAPIFGGDVRPFAFNLLELSGAVRVVNRTISSNLNTAADNADGSTAVTFTAGGRYSPVEGLTFRGNRTRSVRSPSVVELVGAGVTGFTAGGSADFACDADNVNGGPPGGIRRANCISYFAALGLPASLADTLQLPNSARPAAGASNPGLDNEIANNWTVGVVIRPSFIPGLTIESDWVSVDLSGQIGLTLNINACFDSPDFPNTIVGGFDVCNSFVPAVENPMVPGQFVIPAVNPLTGAAVNPVAGIGSPTANQIAGSVGFAFFPTVNQGLTELRALNSTITYQFELADVLGSMANNWGGVQTRGAVYYLDRFDNFATGAANSLNPAAGEPGNPTFRTRLDFAHSIGKLTHTLQWFRDSSTVVNVAIPSEQFPDQTFDFSRPAFNTFNYNVRYEISDNITARFVVNNLTNARLFEEANLAGDTIGRRFIGSVQFNF